MWYSLLRIRNEVVGATWLLYGTLEEIAEVVVEQCGNCSPDGSGVVNFDVIEDEGWYCESYDYEGLVNAENVTPELLKDFSFSLGGSDVCISCFALGYDAFKKAFDEQVQNNWRFSLSEMILPDSVSPDDEADFAKLMAEGLFEEKYDEDLSHWKAK